MSERDLRASTVATLAMTAALAAGPMLVTPASATEDVTTSTKAAIEHEERQTMQLPTGTSTTPTKAQIEHGELTNRPSSTSSTGHTVNGTTADETSQAAATGGDAAAWQLAVAATLGALVTGAAFVGARLVAQHRPSGQAVAG